jgi:NADH-quinone oxidoreductase subunit N
VFAVIASLIGAFYYLRVVKTMYFEEPIATELIEGKGFAKIILTMNASIILLAGIFPEFLTTICLNAMRSSLQG